MEETVLSLLTMYGIDVGLKYAVTDKDVLFLNGGWQDWSELPQELTRWALDHHSG